MHHPENAIAHPVGRGFIATPHVRPDITDKTARRNVTARTEPPAIISQVIFLFPQKTYFLR